MNWNALKLLLITIAVCLSAPPPSHAQEAEAAGVEVTGTAPDVLRQNMPVGPYNQPEWTTERAFGTSRVYVRPPGSIEFNQFWTPEWKDGHVEHSFREEVEIGLPYRLQLDLYQNWGIEEGDTVYRGSSVELRYALANWGKIPLNPTLYGEWNFNDAAPDKWEQKLLLGQTFGRRWNWAGNFTYEQETGGEREQEFALSSALTYALIDQTLNAGVEMLWEHKTTKDSRGDPEIEFLIGPSINVRPTRHSFITVAPLFGTTDDSPDAEIFVIAGFNFRFGGPAGPDEEGPAAPASMFGR
jgi:hypothetical protein